MLNRPRSYLERRFTRLLDDPPSIRLAATVIVSATAVVVLLSGVLMWFIDTDEYPHLGGALWWAAQTVTTVGYGDVTPTHASGRIVGVFVMLYGIAFVTVSVAAITSIFVARASAERGTAEDEADKRIELRLEGIDQRLARLEELLRK
jgi:voltage-gated potassium channel